MPEMRLETEEDRIRTHFRIRYKALRELNIFHSEEQRALRLQRKPSKGRVNKSPDKALKITVILVLMLRMRGLPTTCTHRIFCRDKRCNQHRPALIKEEQRFIHNVREENRDRALFLQTSLIKELELGEFLK